MEDKGEDLILECFIIYHLSAWNVTRIKCGGYPVRKRYFGELLMHKNVKNENAGISHQIMILYNNY